MPRQQKIDTSAESCHVIRRLPRHTDNATSAKGCHVIKNAASSVGYHGYKITIINFSNNQDYNNESDYDDYNYDYDYDYKTTTGSRKQSQNDVPTKSMG